MVALGEHRHDGKAGEAFASRLEALLPINKISTTKYAIDKRKVIGPTGDFLDWSAELTPYALGIQDACDMVGVSCVAVKGNARSVKTTAFENRVMRMWTYGPRVNVLWLMQSDVALTDYIDERGEPMLLHHDEVCEQIDWSDRRNGRLRKIIGKSLALWRVATLKLLIAKAAPIIVADEVDAYVPKVRKALMTLIRNRQREFGTGALAMVGSHPDAGPESGVDEIIRMGIQHLWYWKCPCCNRRSSPAVEAPIRMQWNLPQLLEQGGGEDGGLDRQALMEMIEREAALVCPYDDCAYEIRTDKERREMSATGVWMQPHQSFDPEDPDKIIGDPIIKHTMGFVIHAFMTPFIKLGEIAREFADAKKTADDTGDDENLKNATCKTLGETYLGNSEETRIDAWQVVKARLVQPNERRTVPPGVKFLTAFVDVQGDRFEVRVIGWDLQKRSWLIDAFPLKQWPGFETINPANKLDDWQIIEEAVITQTYPMWDNADRAKRGEPELFMPIAKTVVDAAGEPGVANNAQIWLSNLLGRKLRGETPIIDGWRVQLVHGSARSDGELYGKARQVLHDDEGKKLEPPVYVRNPNVHDIKRIIAKRMKIEDDAPGSMSLYFGVKDVYVRELVSERLINGAWYKNGRNETWDGWVMCEVARALLQPDRPGLWDDGPPIWARPMPRGEGIDDKDRNRVSYFDRLAAYNRGN